MGPPGKTIAACGDEPGRRAAADRGPVAGRALSPRHRRLCPGQARLADRAGCRISERPGRARSRGGLPAGWQSRGADRRLLQTHTAADLSRSGPYLVAAALLLFGPAIIAFIAVSLDPKLAYALVPAQIVQGVHNHQLWTQISPDTRALMSGVIMTNNIQVSILAFAFGVLLGLPTVYVLMTNGIQLGGLLGLTNAYGIAPGLLDFVIAHGVLELSVVVAAGASGLMMGWAILL